MDDELEYSEEDLNEKQEEDEESAPVLAKRHKKKGAARTGEPRIKWLSKE